MIFRFLRSMAYEAVASVLLIFAVWFNYGWVPGVVVLFVTAMWAAAALNYWSDAELLVTLTDLDRGEWRP
jgi:hypothetical protein